MPEDLISVIIPTYKREPELLKRAIDSVLSQDYPALEVIVVDDNAQWPELRSNISALMNGYKEDKRVNHIQNVDNLGGSGSRNQGVRVAKGEFIAFCDDDDWFLPGKLTKQHARLMESGADLCYCWSQGVKTTGEIAWQNCKTKEGNLIVEAMTECIANTSLIMIRREVFDIVGGFDNLPCKQDVMLELKLASYKFVFVCVPEILVNYGCVDDSFERISNISSKTIVGTIAVWDYARKNYDKLTPQQIRFVESDTAFKLCGLARKLNDKSTFFKYLKVGLKNAPFSRDSLKYLIYSVLWNYRSR